MTWLAKPPLARILKGVALAFTLVTMPLLSHAQGIWSEYAMISGTLGVSDSRICIGEASRGDIGCPSFAPTISPTGRINASAGLTVDTISLTTTGTTWGYVGSSASYLPNFASNAVSTTTISTTMVQIASTTTVTACDSGSMGALRYNSTSASLELCNGTEWQGVGSGGGMGMPTGTIAAFASSTCPSGWDEYTAARGRFLRGIDNGAGNDPDGTRAPGSVQADANRSHSHTGTAASAGAHTHTYYKGNSGSTSGFGSSGTAGTAVASSSNGAHTHTLAINSDGEAEARPKNVAVIFCVYTGSGGAGGTSSTVVATDPAGFTGQIQYNTSGSFDASAGLTWDNAASRLTAANISTTALTVNGVAITGSGSGDRITSGTTSMIANPSGMIEVNGTIQLMSPTEAPTCTEATLGSIATINGRLYHCKM